MPWWLFLSEASVEPSEEFLNRFAGAEKVYGRFWLWEGDLSPEDERRLFPFGEEEVAGKVYARVVAKGASLDELRQHPIAAKMRESLQTAYYTHMVNSRISQAMEVLQRARRFGFEEGLKELDQKAEMVQKMRIILSTAGAPFNLLEDGRIAIGNPPAFTLETLEEAEKVAKVYSWSRKNRVRIAPSTRGKDGEIRFFAELVPLQVNNGHGVIPLTEKPYYPKGFFALERRPGGAVARPVPLTPVKDVLMIFLPWMQT